MSHADKAKRIVAEYRDHKDMKRLTDDIEDALWDAREEGYERAAERSREGLS